MKLWHVAIAAVAAGGAVLYFVKRAKAAPPPEEPPDEVPPEPPLPPATITCYVYGPAGETIGVGDITIILDGARVPASSWWDNWFKIKDVQIGYHTLVVRKPGYQDWSWEGNVDGDMGHRVDLTQ